MLTQLNVVGIDNAPEAWKNTKLECFASLLNCPVEAFSDPQKVPNHLAQTKQLLEIWQAIEDPELGRRVIQFAESLVESAP